MYKSKKKNSKRSHKVNQQFAGYNSAHISSVNTAMALKAKSGIFAKLVDNLRNQTKKKV